MTVVAAPLLLALDGTLLTRNNANAASYLLDPMDYSREGLVRAVKRSAPSKGIATMLAKSEHYYPGYYAKYLLTHGSEDFRTQVMPYLQDDDAHAPPRCGTARTHVASSRRRGPRAALRATTMLMHPSPRADA